ncbi:class I SAM-dependent methyltransferase [Ekhidna sp.]|uniref:class I SAM-dependent methyltransferase n=1 Tax=Ekhidna sp. TaxID=2608089 RepID=UPI003CCC3C2A
MTVTYDKYYQTADLFGEPYPELINFFSEHPTRGKLLDLGCGQGRDAIPLAKLGFNVSGVDSFSVGIGQMRQAAESGKLDIVGIADDIYHFQDYAEYEFILLDSMFHFRKSELAQESKLIKQIIQASKKGTLIVFCIQNTRQKIYIFDQILNNTTFDKRIVTKDFKHAFNDASNNHSSETNYQMIVIAPN